jgi:hypothetical protein
MAKTFRVIIDFEVPNSATIAEERARIVDVARGFISHKIGKPVEVVSVTVTKRVLKGSED